MASFTGMVGFLPNFMLTCRMFRAEGEHWDFRAGERGPSQVYRRSGCRGNRACVRARWPTWIHEPFSRRRRLVESWDHLFAWPLYFFFCLLPHRLSSGRARIRARHGMIRHSTSSTGMSHHQRNRGKNLIQMF
jgi:hypothetical protein